MQDLISRQAAIDAFHTWFRDGFDEDKWWNSTHVLAAIEGIPSVHQKYTWETCFDCPLSHGCPKIKGCTNEQAMEYASKIPNDCPLSAQPERKTDGDTISRQAVLDKKELIELEDGQSFYCISPEDVETLPPVTPQPKTGHWRHYEGMLICSKCGTEFYDDIMEYCGDDVPRCCPDCGSRNKRAEEEE